MMKNNRVEVVILYEDKLHSSFATHFFSNYLGCKLRNIRPIPIHEGKGAAEQHVREGFAQQVKTFRSKPYIQSSYLVVIIDADMKTVQERVSQLDEKLKDSRQVPRRPDERIIIFVPKRNIETWLYYLMGNFVDEVTNYKQTVQSLLKNDSCKSLAKKLAETCRVGLPLHAPPSLQMAYEELHRLVE